MVGDTLVLLTSDGILYRFVEGADQTVVPYLRVDTGRGDRCEFEGMAFEESSNALLLACKKVYDRALRGSVVILRWPLGAVGAGVARPSSQVAMPLAGIIGSNGWEQFEPSDLTMVPSVGHYLVVASRQKGLVEVTATGALVSARALPAGHEQAEGIAITQDGLLLLSDEAKGGPAVLTVYRWPGGATR
jgi:hypothetical protein